MSMSRYSAEIPYFHTEGITSFHFTGKRNGVTIEEIHIAKPYRLSAIIHEINECEISHLLTEEFADETEGIIKIKITEKVLYDAVMTFGLPLVFSAVDEKIFISHMISPYATGDCFMPRRKYRVFW